MKKSKMQWSQFLFVIPSLLGVAVFILCPFLDVIRRSFLSAVTEEWAGLSNYKTIFENEAFLLAGKNTLRFLVVCIPMLLLISLAIAVFLQKHIRSSQMLKTAFLIPMVIPVSAVALLWKVFFHNQGLLNGLLHKLEIGGVDWLGSSAAFWVLVITYIWKNLGYNIVLWMAGLCSIPTSIYEAARVDGAGEWKCFLKVTLPNLLPVFCMVTILGFVNSFKVFREGYMVAGNYPDESMYLLQHLFNNWYQDLDFDKMAAGAVVMAFVILAAIVLLHRMWDHEEKEN